MRTSMEMKKPKATKYEIVLGLRNITINMCNFMNGKMDSAFVGLFVKDLKVRSNLIQPCPYSVKYCNILCTKINLSTPSFFHADPPNIGKILR